MPEGSGALRFSLVIASGRRRGESVPLTSAMAELGRAEDNDVVLAESGVSRHHARLVYKAGRYFAEDIGSTNGTRVNGRRIEGLRPLAAGDTLAVGTVFLGFTVGEKTEALTLTGGALTSVTQSGEGTAALAARLLASNRLFQLVKSPRRAGLAAAAVLLAALGFSLFYGHPSGTPPSSEPTRLTSVAVVDSFGLGRGVTWRHRDSKRFDFDVFSPTPVVALLHYQAAGLSEGEVQLALNGGALGNLPADFSDASVRHHTLTLPRQRLRHRGTNQVLFRNLHNSARGDPWRVWNLWVEVLPVPDLPDAALLPRARALADHGRRLARARAVAPENLFRAWEETRSAWTLSLALNAPGELETQTRRELLELEGALEAQCGKFLMEAERSVNLKSPIKARHTLEAVEWFFPKADHRCRARARDRLRSLEVSSNG